MSQREVASRAPSPTRCAAHTRRFRDGVLVEEETAGFVGSTVVLVLSVGGLFVYFKRKGWL